MPWFRVDDSFHEHPKVFDAPDCAVALWTRAGTWSAHNLTDGFVPSSILARFTGDPQKAARELVRRGLWFRVKGGFQFHDWHDYQPTREAVENDRKMKTERQRRWREAKRRRPVDASTHASRDASKDGAPYPPRPEGSGAVPAPKRAANGGRPTPSGPATAAAKPPWCGTCDETTRQTGDPPKRCPNCHPLTSTGTPA
jgi:hypothetical protein